jgi:tripartite-type tricarboxylate transporter receptor subunit TctC
MMTARKMVHRLSHRWRSAKASREDNMKRIGSVLFALAAAYFICTVPASAQAWPNKPVRIVNTFAPGGAADFLCRTVADGMAAAFGQPFFVETHAGAAGQIGIQAVINTPPDGYNFVLTNITMLVFAPITNPKLGYDPHKDLSNIAYIGGSPIVLTVNAKGSIKTLDDFVAAGKGEKPLTYSSSGVGSNGHLFAESLAQKFNIKVEHVPYKGAAQGLMDLVGGHISFAAQSLTSSAGQIRGGTLRPIVQTANVRMADFPDIPTLKELGYPELSTNTWFSLSAPAGLPADIAQRVNREIAKTMAKPEMQQRMRQEGMVTEALSPEEFKALIDRETQHWRPVIEKAGLIEK